MNDSNFYGFLRGANGAHIRACVLLDLVERTLEFWHVMPGLAILVTGIIFFSPPGSSWENLFQ